jgi:hypothetical protein
MFHPRAKRLVASAGPIEERRALLARKLKRVGEDFHRPLVTRLLR